MLSAIRAAYAGTGLAARMPMSVFTTLGPAPFGPLAS